MKYIDYDKIAQEAAIRYPIGTEYYALSPNENEWKTVEVIEKLPEWVSKKERVEGSDLMDAGFGYIYVDGKWANTVNENINLNIEPIYEIY